MSNVQHFTVTAGEDRTLNLTALDRDRAVFDLTGASLKFHLIDEDTDRRVLEKDGTIDTAASGTWNVTLTDSDTEKRQGRFRYLGYATISGTTTLVNEGKIPIRSGGLRILTDYGR